MSSSPYLEQAIRQGETLIRYLNLQIKYADELLADDRKDVMMSLDDTLREILDFRKGTTDDRIAQIKQVFDEAGYIKHDEYGVVQVYTHNATNVMTGAEWYNRFKAELEQLPNTDVFDDVLEAARRAANLSEDSK